MAKFRNVDKRRSRTTGNKILRSARMQTKQAEPLDEVTEAMEEYYSAHPMATGQPQTVRAKTMYAVGGPVADDGDVQPLGAAPIEGDLWVKYFALMFSSLRRWFRGFWSTPRFTHSAA